MLDLGFISFDNTWKDKVTFVSGVGSITYDAIGNPLTYGSNTFTWTAGRQLASVTNANDTITKKRIEKSIRFFYIPRADRFEKTVGFFIFQDNRLGQLNLYLYLFFVYCDANFEQMILKQTTSENSRASKKHQRMFLAIFANLKIS
jgi:hypothetical protein